MFPPVKRVTFRDRLEELIPTRPVDELPHHDTEDTEEAIVPPREEGGEASEGDDVPSTPVQGRRKRRRDWVWTLGPIEVGARPVGPDEEAKERERPDPDPGPCGIDDAAVLVVDGTAESHESEGVALLNNGSASASTVDISS